MIAPAYLLNPVNVGSTRLQPGALLTDAGVQAGAMAAGGVLLPANDTAVARAAKFAEAALRRGDVIGAASHMMTVSARALPSTVGNFLWKGDGGGDARTFADVAPRLADVTAPIDIAVDGTNVACEIPASAGRVDMRGSRFVGQNLSANHNEVHLDDGAVLANFGGLRLSAQLHVRPSSAPCFAFDGVYGGGGGVPPVFVLDLGSSLVHEGSVPAFVVPDGALLGVFISGAFTGIQCTGGAPFVQLGVGSILLVAAVDGAQMGPNFVLGPASSVLVWQTTGGAGSPLPVNAGFNGATINNPVGPGFSWTIATRPTSAFSVLPVGLTGYNSDLGQLEFWDGSTWIQLASGAGGVPTGRRINTTAPMTGGGDLTADRTFAMPAAAPGTDGYMPGGAATALASLVAHAVLDTRQVNTTAPMTGGGALSGDLTLAVPLAVGGTSDGLISAASQAKLDGLGATPPAIDVFEVQTQVAGPITGPDAWRNLLTLTVHADKNTVTFLCDVAVAYRSETPSPNPINAKWRITIDGTELVTWNSAAQVTATTAWTQANMKKLSAALAVGDHVVNLDWSTDAQSAFSEQIEINDGGDFFGNRATLIVTRRTP